MSIDHSWTARLPGPIPLVMIRSGLERANVRLAPKTRLTIVIDEGEEPGALEAIARAGAVFDVQAEGLGDITLFQPDGDDDRFHMALSSSTEGRGRHLEELAEAANTLADALGLVLDAAPTRLTDAAAREPRASAARSPRAEGKAPLEDLVAWAGEAGLRHESTEDNLAHFERIDESGESIPPLITLSLTDRDVDLLAFPELELDHTEALELNDVELRGPTKLALDEDGDWSLACNFRRKGLDRAAFLETLTEFLEDLEDLLDAHGAPDDDDESEGGEDQDQDQDAALEADAAREIAARSDTQILKLERYSAAGRSVVSGAQKLADTSHHAEVTLLHILSSCLDLSAAKKLCEGVGAEVDAARGLLEPQLAVLSKGDEQAYVSQTALAFLRYLDGEHGEAEIKFPDVLRGLVAFANAESSAPEVRALRRVIKAGKLERLISEGER